MLSDYIILKAYNYKMAYGSSSLSREIAHCFVFYEDKRMYAKTCLEIATSNRQPQRVVKPGTTVTGPKLSQWVIER